MEALRLTLLFLHFGGLAALFGGFMAQMRTPVRQVTPLMLTGAVTQVVTGVLLVGVREIDDLAVDRPKMVVKLIVALLALGTAWAGIRAARPARGSAVTGRPASGGAVTASPATATAVRLFLVTGLLAATNVAVAVFWT